MRVGAVNRRTATSRTQRVQIAQKIAAPEAAPSAPILAPVVLLDTHRTQMKSDVSQLKGKGDVVDVTVVELANPLRVPPAMAGWQQKFDSYSSHSLETSS